MATIKASSEFNPEKAAKTLRKALKGLGTDESKLIKVLVSHNIQQRLKISEVYKTTFDKDLLKDVKSDLSGKLEAAVTALLVPTPTFLATELRKAIKGIGTDESVLIEILCGSSNKEIDAIKFAYNHAFGRNLKEDIVGETKGDFKRLLLTQVNTERNESLEVDKSKSKHDAKAIFDAGEGQFGTNDSVFNKILCDRSFLQLRCIFDEYKAVSGRDIEDAVKRETSGVIRDGFLAIVQYAKGKKTFFAERLYKSMKGAGTDDDTLIRIVISRAEIDLALIAATFAAKYGKTLTDFIEGDCSGNYKKLLLAVVRGN